MFSRVGVALALAVLAASPAAAQVHLTTGAGSAVTSVGASADFESQAALNGNPYSEGGLIFSRTNLSFDNNTCGYAGCDYYAPFDAFSGNYMYGVGDNGYFEIMTGGADFSALEFTVASGYNEDPLNVTWSAFLNGAVVGSGSTTVAQGSVIGFTGSPFDTLRYTNYYLGQGTAPAFDSVRAQFSLVASVPEPATWAMMLIGFAGIGFTMRRKRRVAATGGKNRVTGGLHHA